MGSRCGRVPATQHNTPGFRARPKAGAGPPTGHPLPVFLQLMVSDKRHIYASGTSERGDGNRSSVSLNVNFPDLKMSEPLASRDPLSQAILGPGSEPLGMRCGGGCFPIPRRKSLRSAGRAHHAAPHTCPSSTARTRPPAKRLTPTQACSRPPLQEGARQLF